MMNLLDINFSLNDKTTQIILICVLVAFIVLLAVISIVIVSLHKKRKSAVAEPEAEIVPEVEPLPESGTEIVPEVEPLPEAETEIVPEVEPLPEVETEIIPELKPLSETDTEIINEIEAETACEPVFVPLNTEEEEEDEEEDNVPEEEEVVEEVRVDEKTGVSFVVRYRKSFTAKYIQSGDINKSYYTMLKNALLSYKKVKTRLGWGQENFNFGRVNIARFTMRGKSLCVYFALNPDDYADTKYKVERSESKKYEAVPCMYRIKNGRRAKYALDLISALAEKFGLIKSEDMNENYYLPYEETQALIDRGLIKETVFKKGEESLSETETLEETAVTETEIQPEEIKKEVIRQQSFEEVKEKQREEVNAYEADEIITDEVATVLIEVKRKTKREDKFSSGKKGIINIDVLSENFESGETVTLETLKDKKLLKANVASYKVLARGSITKPLIVEANEFSIEAVKMIVLTGGRAIKIH